VDTTVMVDLLLGGGFDALVLDTPILQHLVGGGGREAGREDGRERWGATLCVQGALCVQGKAGRGSMCAGAHFMLDAPILQHQVGGCIGVRVCEGRALQGGLKVGRHGLLTSCWWQDCSCEVPVRLRGAFCCLLQPCLCSTQRTEL
jgi:hypothetical protein